MKKSNKSFSKISQFKSGIKIAYTNSKDELFCKIDDEFVEAKDKISAFNLGRMSMKQEIIKELKFKI